MRKEDLKTGMVVDCVNGNRYLVLRNADLMEADVLVRPEGFERLKNYDDELHNINHSAYDIARVYKVVHAPGAITRKDHDLRLIWERPAYYNGKVVCIENFGNERMYTVGKIYEFKDGKLTADDGRIFPFARVKCFDDWKNHTSSKFIEVVE